MKIGLASLSFIKIVSLTAILYVKVSCDVYPYFPRFIADAGEIPYERSAARVLLGGCDFRENRLMDFREN